MPDLVALAAATAAEDVELLMLILLAGDEALDEALELDRDMFLELDNGCLIDLNVTLVDNLLKY